MTELDVVSNFDCARQNRFRSLETSNQGNKIIQTNNSSEEKFHDNQINSIRDKLKKP